MRALLQNTGEVENSSISSTSRQKRSRTLNERVFDMCVRTSLLSCFLQCFSAVTQIHHSWFASTGTGLRHHSRKWLFENGFKPSSLGATSRHTESELPNPNGTLKRENTELDAMCSHLTNIMSAGHQLMLGENNALHPNFPTRANTARNSRGCNHSG